MTTGEVLRVRAAMKPIATVPRALRTVDVATGEEPTAHHQRSDVCAVPAAGIVAEAMVALVLADAVLEKFGGDSRPGDPAQRRVLPRHPEVHSDRRCRVVVLVGPMGAGKTTVGGAARRGLGRRRARHRRRHRGARGAARSPTSSWSPARRTSATSSARRSPRRWPPTTACWRSAGVRCSTPATRELLAGQTVVFLRVGLSDAVKRVGLGTRATAAAGQRARPDQGAARRADAGLRGGRHAAWSTPTGAPPDEVAAEIVARRWR